MARKYRNPTKKRMYDNYAIQSNVLSERLKCGDMTQEEYDRAHEELDDRFRYVR